MSLSCHGRASLRDCIRTVRLPLEAGADKDIADVIGLTALFNVAMEGQLEVVRLLVKAGAQIDACLEHFACLYISIHLLLSVYVMFIFIHLYVTRLWRTRPSALGGDAIVDRL